MARIVLLRWPGLLSARAQSQVAEIEQALEQHQLRDHHRRLIRYSLSHMAFLEQQILDLDRDMQAKIQQAARASLGTAAVCTGNPATRRRQHSGTKRRGHETVSLVQVFQLLGGRVPRSQPKRR